jgi:CPA2 family monovalent cation:H+ antiporter-2
VLIAGYGVNGRNLARVLRDIDIPFTVMELNPETVRQAQKNGEPVVYGDCSRLPVLEHLGIHEARIFVIGISDPATTRRAVSVARQANPHLYLLVRTRYVAEVDELRKLGADEIIPEEFETSVEIFARVLFRYDIPRNLILDLIDRIREGHYEVFRDVSLPATRLELPFDVLSHVRIESCLIRAASPAVGKALKDLPLRATTGALIIGVRRDKQLLLNPESDFTLQAGDTTILLGDRAQVDRALVFLDPELSHRQAD